MSTQDQLAVSYDVANDFFRLWLDERMIYSGALFYPETKSLEEAQVNKLTWFHDKTRLTPQSRVLDVGCGWGGLIRFLAKDKGVGDVVGITLSKAQYAEVIAQPVAGASAECISYIDYEPTKLFDAAISIGMFEHLATPEQARTGESLQIYRKYFQKVWQWTKPGSLFGLQSVIGGRIPRKGDALRDLGWATHTIFPGAISPRLEVVISAVNPYWEVMEVHTRREHYEKTSAEWQRRLRLHETEIRERWGNQIFDDYDRYLGACVTCFREGYQSLVQMVLRRID